MPQKPNHILVIRLSAMGDVAMIVPVLRAFVKQYPAVKITVLTREFFSPFFRDLNNVQVYKADVRGKHKGLLGLYKLASELKQLNCDAIADLHNVLRSKILKLFLHKRAFVQIDKGRNEKRKLIKGIVFQQLKTTHQRYADVFEQLGFKLSLENPVFPKKAELDKTTLSIIGDCKMPTIGIAPFAAYQSKTYPINLMEKVIEQLSPEYRIVLFGGGEKETAVLDELAHSHQNTINLAGKLTLEQELDIISNLELMLAMDSANAHIAAMQGIKVVTIWGVTHPYAGFYPFDQNPKNALLADRNKYKKIPTSIYGKAYPKGYEHAIATIAPQEIIDKVKEVIKTAP
jgi:ADP-heptose:LPS heptosyltransferase